MMNQMRTRLEIVLLRRLDIDSKFVNYLELHGFRKRRSTASALQQLQRIIATRKKGECSLFADFSKAYNHYRVEKLIGILEERYGDEKAEEVEIVKQILRKDSINIGGNYHRAENGTPQGEPLSPSLFNIYVDRMFSELKKRIPGLRLIDYADDLDICGQFNLADVQSVFEEYNLVLNKFKSQNFFVKLGGINHRKRYNYLGFRIDDAGKIKGTTSVIKFCGKKSLVIGKNFARYNDQKAWRLVRAYVKPKWKYIKRAKASEDLVKRMEEEWLKNVKAALELPKLLPPLITEKAAQKLKERLKKNELATIVTFLRSHDKLMDTIEIFRVTPEMLDLPFATCRKKQWEEEVGTYKSGSSSGEE